MRGKRFLGQRIQPAFNRVPGDSGIEMPGIEGREPGTEPRQLWRGQPFNGFFDVFSSGHDDNHSISGLPGCQQRLVTVETDVTRGSKNTAL